MRLDLFTRCVNSRVLITHISLGRCHQMASELPTVMVSATKGQTSGGNKRRGYALPLELLGALSRSRVGLYEEC